MDAEIRRELGIPIRVKPEPVKERKPWEQQDEDDDQDPNLLLVLIGGFIRQTPCYLAWMRWKRGQAKDAGNDGADVDADARGQKDVESADRKAEEEEEEEEEEEKGAERRGRDAAGWTRIPLEDIPESEEDGGEGRGGGGRGSDPALNVHDLELTHLPPRERLF